MNHMIRCAKKFGVEVPSGGPIKRRRNASLPLRGGGSAKRVAVDAFEGEEMTERHVCSYVPVSKRQRTAEIAECKSMADVEASLAADDAERGLFRCPYHDGMVYGTKKKLEWHCKQHVKLKGMYACKHCPVQPNMIPVEFLTASKLRQHLRQFHADVVRAHADEVSKGMDVIDIASTRSMGVPCNEVSM